MVQLAVLMAGLLLIAESQASEEGFLSKSDATKSSMNEYDKFIIATVNRGKHGNGPDALAHHNNLAEHGPAVADIKAVPNMAARDNDSSMPITLPAIGVGLLALVTMIVARMRTGATSVIAPGLNDNFMEMQSQGTARRETSARVGWGQMSSQNSRPPTFCYATPKKVMEMEGVTLPFGFFDPLGLSNNASDELICWYREAELKHGRVAMAAFVGFLINYSDITFPANLTMSGEKFSSLGTKAPLAAWDNISDKGKWSILGFIGLLEVLGEAEKPHYMRGGKSGTNKLVWNFGDKYLSGKTEEQKRSSRNAEINNGRLAMLGVMSLIAGSTIQGSVPFFDGVPLEQYTGSVWAPF
jgi:hypothetical protein